MAAMEMAVTEMEGEIEAFQVSYEFKVVIIFTRYGNNGYGNNGGYGRGG